MVTITRSGDPYEASSGLASLRSTSTRRPTVSALGDSRSCGNVSHDGNCATPPPSISVSSEVRSSASRPVAVTSSTGVRAASAAAMNGRAGFGATMSKAAEPMDSITGVNAASARATSASPASAVWAEDKEVNERAPEQ
ncbi:Uncharacterized protein G9444_4522 [Rhodococcus erythropolis]|uniref:Uncharacterized protein n=1 Tax=Rhodococcus erythropolis TaxID=1833 RepID=A0A6G9CYI2_RHOER|nr:Uncharacterized protein G9444_4522 [Rhodococcus erythropolis]